jgi:hypothetical protein
MPISPLIERDLGNLKRPRLIPFTLRPPLRSFPASIVSQGKGAEITGLALILYRDRYVRQDFFQK